MVLLWLTQIGANRQLHHDESIKLASKASKINFAIIVLASVASLCSFLNVFDSVKWLQTTLKVISGVTSIVIVLLSSILSSQAFDEKAEKHRRVAAQYNDLSNLIQVTTMLDEKPDAEQFLKRIVDQFHFIEQLNPDALAGESSTADLPNLFLLKGANVPDNYSRKNTVVDFITEQDKDIFNKSTSDDNLAEILIQQAMDTTAHNFGVAAESARRNSKDKGKQATQRRNAILAAEVNEKANGKGELSNSK